MKRLLLLVASALFVMNIFSCKEVESLKGRSRILEDSMVNIFPTYESLHIELNDDETEITVVVGDLKFYPTSAEEKSKKAEELGKLIVRVYGTENYLNKGTLIATKDRNNTSNTPADGIATPIELKKMKELLYKK